MILKVNGLKFRTTFLFMFFLIYLTFLNRFLDVVVFLISMFLHEIAHAVTAWGFGCKIDEIELMPFGGVARIKNMFAMDDLTEAIVALVGPLTNFGIAISVILLKNNQIFLSDASVIDTIVRANIILAVFNLLPVLPLDGGRVLKLYLASFIGYGKAVDITVFGGKLLAAVLFFGGFLMFYYNRTINPLIFLLSGFLFYAAQKEKRFTGYKIIKSSSLKKIKIKKNGCLNIKTLAVISEAPVKEVIQRFSPKNYYILVVIEGDNWNVKKIVSETELIEGWVEKGFNAKIKDII
ncbi:MAG: stage sporulation protein [Thermosediminibacterales bacterium]|nr:stage sporulation protein [Thermosediminibacterales bacterium]MDK2835522.1 stage sporulation protein [Thermosediminibacterales bacterium]